ncbi:hypothetical protein GEMRC1_007906 [Eukaryota sp. GEM-RC1]
MQLIQSHERTVPGQRKRVHVPTLDELFKAIEEAVYHKEKLSILSSWAASVAHPVICVNDFEKLLKQFPTEKDDVASLLKAATFFRPRPHLYMYCRMIPERINHCVVAVAEEIYGTENMLFTPWDMAVFASCLPVIETKMKMIQLCAPLLEYERPADCEIIYTCISGKADKAMAKKFIKAGKRAILPLLIHCWINGVRIGLNWLKCMKENAVFISCS